MKRTYVLILLMCFAAAMLHAESAGEENIRDAIVKVYATYNTPDYWNPWSMRGPRSRTGSGAVIEGRYILTNAHVVSDATFVQVRLHGESARFTAEVHHVLHQADLALLKVSDPKFAEGVVPLELGELPETYQEVSVYGFPLGGDALSITKGIVSRIEHQRYVHSSLYLLAGQIDAAINPGSSGGPVISGGRIAGVTMQSIPMAQNIGYMVPAPIVKKFIDDALTGGATGFPSIGAVFQPMESRHMREYYRLGPDQSGVLVKTVFPGSAAEGKLLPDDVLLSIDGLQVGNDGTVEFRPQERTWLSYAVQRRSLGEEVTAEVLRKGEQVSVSLELNATADDLRLIPMEQYETLPSYSIYGGFVLMPLTKNLLMEWGDNWMNTAPKHIIALYQENVPENFSDQLIMLSRVLPADINDGYQNIMFRTVTSINGIPVTSMEDAVQILDRTEEEFTVLVSMRGERIILRHEDAVSSHQEVLMRYRITHDRSEDLRELEGKQF